MTRLFMLMWLFPLFLLFTGIETRIKTKLIKTPIKDNVTRFQNDKRAYLYSNLKQNRFWESLNGYEFEQYVGQVFSSRSYKVHQTKLSCDGCVDLILEKNSRKTAVQCKAHKKAVGPSAVRDLYGTMQHFGYQKGILVSLNGFTSGVYTFVKDKEIELISVHELIMMGKLRRS